jgi:LPXTG-site transpeptidase (sortase) family protein
MRNQGKRILLAAEKLFLVVGIVALLIYGAVFGHSHFFRAYDQWAFNQTLKGEPSNVTAFLSHLAGFSSGANKAPLPARGVKPVDRQSGKELIPGEGPDQDEWSAKRVRSYQRSVSKNSLPLARLEIPAIDLSAMVLEGTDTWTLNRGVGHIRGTAPPGVKGNTAIAGHRDGFFRGLRNISKNDRIVLTTVNGTYLYRVANIKIVSPNHTEVLEPTREPVLTLVTCYPFFFVGDAPKRYIVTSRLVEHSLTAP